MSRWLRRTRRRAGRVRGLAALVAAVVAGCLCLSGCDFDVYDLPLPGGADTGAHPMTLHVEFADVLDLVPESAVKVNDVSVGKVKDVRLVDGHADVTVEVRRDTRLPADATAQIRQTSLLGEKFVDLVAPAAGSTTTLLRDGDRIPLARSGRNPEIEEVLGALSLVLNGGGVAQLKTISTELNKALGGHEEAARSVLSQVDLLVKNLDDNKASIVRALDSIDRLSKSVRTQEGTIDATLAELPGALRSIDAQRRDFVTMLQALSRLGDVGTHVINASKDATIQVVRNLQPTLTQLAASGDNLVKSIDTALTYPFVDDVVGRDPQVARSLHMGDYVNLAIDLQADLGGPLEAAASGSVVPSAINPTATVGNVVKCLASGKLTSASCKAVLASVSATLNLVNECKKPANKGAAVCKALNQLAIGLPTTGADPLGDLVGGLGLGLGRAAPAGPAGSGTGAGSTAGSGGSDRTVTTRITYDGLTALYDPTLVRLLVPGLDTAGTSQSGAVAR